MLLMHVQYRSIIQVEQARMHHLFFVQYFNSYDGFKLPSKDEEFIDVIQIT